MQKAKKLGKKAPVEKKPAFTIEVSLNGETWKTKSDDILAGLKEFEVPFSIKSEAVFKVSRGGKSAEVVNGVFRARRIFGNSTAMQLLAINLGKRLNG